MKFDENIINFETKTDKTYKSLCSFSTVLYKGSVKNLQKRPTLCNFFALVSFDVFPTFLQNTTQYSTSISEINNSIFVLKRKQANISSGPGEDLTTSFECDFNILFNYFLYVCKTKLYTVLYSIGLDNNHIQGNQKNNISLKSVCIVCIESLYTPIHFNSYDGDFGGFL